jgi:hypothetical protein
MQEEDFWLKEVSSEKYGMIGPHAKRMEEGYGIHRSPLLFV